MSKSTPKATKKSNTNLLNIQKRLQLFGITKEAYELQTGNLTGNMRVPNQLLAYNPDLTIDEAFYFVAIKIFQTASLFCFNIPVQFKYNWQQVVGESVYETFRQAIFEEINQRFLSNNFPEFDKQNLVLPSNLQVLQSSNEKFNVKDYLNPITKQILSTIDWKKINPEEQYNSAKFQVPFLRNDMANLKVVPGVTEQQFLMANTDGTFLMKSEKIFLKAASQEKVNSQVNTNSQNIQKFNNLIQNLDQKILNVENKYNTLVLPTATFWNSNQMYSEGNVIFYDWQKLVGGEMQTFGGFFVAKKANVNKIPNTNIDYWAPITQTFENKEGDVVYEAGTDIKFAFAKPSKYYISFEKLWDAKANVFEGIKKEYPNFNQSQYISFCQNFFGNSNPDEKTICERLQFIWRLFFPIDSEIKFFMSPQVNGENGVNNDFLGLVQLEQFGDYIRIGTSYQKNQGSNKISQQNLPNLKFNLDHAHRFSSITSSTNFDKSLVFRSWSLTPEFQENGVGAWPPFERRREKGWSVWEKKTVDYSGFVGFAWTRNFNQVWWSANLINHEHGLFDLTGTTHNHNVTGDTNYWRYSLNLNPQPQIEFAPKFTSFLAYRHDYRWKLRHAFYVNFLPIRNFENPNTINFANYWDINQTSQHINQKINQAFVNCSNNNFISKTTGQTPEGLPILNSNPGCNITTFSSFQKELQNLQSQVQNFQNYEEKFSALKQDFEKLKKELGK